MSSSDNQKYSMATSALHWIGALLILATIAVAKIMEDASGQQLLDMVSLHRTLGLATGVAFLLRLFFFFKHARPTADPAWPKWQAFTAKILHLLLYLMPLILVASGMAAMIAFGLQDMLVNGDAVGFEAALDIPPLMVHGLVADLLIISIGLHIVAALYHQFVQKDNLLSRITLRRG